MWSFHVRVFQKKNYPLLFNLTKANSNNKNHEPECCYKENQKKG